VRTIHSSPFSTENSLRPDLFTSLDVAGAQCDSRIALLKSKAMARAQPRHTHEVWLGRRFVVAPWRLLPLLRVKKFNSQEMGGRTLKVDIAKSGAPAAKTASTAAAAGTASTRAEKWWSELTTREGLRGDRPPARRVDMKAIQRSQNLALSSWCFGPDDRPGGWNVPEAL